MTKCLPIVTQIQTSTFRMKSPNLNLRLHVFQIGTQSVGMTGEGEMTAEVVVATISPEGTGVTREITMVTDEITTVTDEITTVTDEITTVTDEITTVTDEEDIIMVVEEVIMVTEVEGEVTMVTETDIGITTGTKGTDMATGHTTEVPLMGSMLLIKELVK